VPAVPVHESRDFYRLLVEEGLLPATFDVDGMRLPGDPPPLPELETPELAAFVRDDAEPAAWAGLDAGRRWQARQAAYPEWQRRIGGVAAAWAADPANAPDAARHHVRQIRLLAELALLQAPDVPNPDEETE
jgi:hypothetical protein